MPLVHVISPLSLWLYLFPAFANSIVGTFRSPKRYLTISIPAYIILVGENASFIVEIVLSFSKFNLRIKKLINVSIILALTACLVRFPVVTYLLKSFLFYRVIEACLQYKLHRRHNFKSYRYFSSSPPGYCSFCNIYSIRRAFSLIMIISGNMRFVL